MRKLYFLTLSILTLFPYNIMGVNSGDSQKDVLIMCALAPTTPAYKPILDGIRLELYRSFGDSCNLRVKYPESEIFDNIVEDNNRTAAILKSLRGLMNGVLALQWFY